MHVEQGQRSAPPLREAPRAELAQGVGPEVTEHERALRTGHPEKLRCHLREPGLPQEAEAGEDELEGVLSEGEGIGSSMHEAAGGEPESSPAGGRGSIRACAVSGSRIRHVGIEDDLGRTAGPGVRRHPCGDRLRTTRAEPAHARGRKRENPTGFETKGQEVVVQAKPRFPVQCACEGSPHQAGERRMGRGHEGAPGGGHPDRTGGDGWRMAPL